MPETFSSEIGDVHERPQAATSFSTEFRGASDSLIDRERQPRLIGRSRGAKVLVIMVLVAGLLGGGGFALWYWAEPVGEWLASLNPSDAPAPAPEPAPTQPAAAPEPAPKEPEPTPPLDDPPAGDGASVAPTPMPTPIGGELPVEELDNPIKPAKVKSGATSARGRVSIPSVNAKLTAVDTAIEGCWEGAIADPQTKRPATLTLRFTIGQDGGASGISVTGSAPSSLTSCVRGALPGSGWPKPSDAEATITRSWTLE
ncbi:MAG: hypothetical protein R6X02_25755 [Enhygromyxa sp.]